MTLSGVLSEIAGTLLGHSVRVLGVRRERKAYIGGKSVSLLSMRMGDTRIVGYKSGT